IGRLADRLASDPAVHRRRRRDRHLRRPPGVRLHEAEVLEHRMAAEIDLVGHARSLRPRGHAGKRYPLVHRVALDAGETPEEMEVPPRTAELAVGDRREPALLLPLDDLLDLAVLGRLEISRGYLALRRLRPRLLHRRRAQQAADLIGAKRRLGALHGN